MVANLKINNCKITNGIVQDLSIKLGIDILESKSTPVDPFSSNLYPGSMQIMMHDISQHDSMHARTPSPHPTSACKLRKLPHAHTTPSARPVRSSGPQSAGTCQPVGPESTTHRPQLTFLQPGRPPGGTGGHPSAPRQPQPRYFSAGSI